LDRIKWTSSGDLSLTSDALCKYLGLAASALAELDGEKAEQLFLELVLAIEEAVNKNQKGVAAELQRVAKEIEAGGKVDDALRFKQRTCEVMLRRSMAERRRNQAPPAPLKDTRALNQLIFICFAADPPSYGAFLQRTGLASELRVLPDGSRWMRSKDSQLLLVCRQGRLSGFFPLFVALSREDAAKQLQETGHFLDGEEVDVCGMKLLVIKDKSAQRFLLAGAEILQNI
jgi:hypothetical protein